MMEKYICFIVIHMRACVRACFEILFIRENSFLG